MSHSSDDQSHLYRSERSIDMETSKAAAAPRYSTRMSGVTAVKGSPVSRLHARRISPQRQELNQIFTKIFLSLLGISKGLKCEYLLCGGVLDLGVKVSEIDNPTPIYYH